MKITVKAIISSNLLLTVLAVCFIPAAGSGATAASDSVPVGKITAETEKLWSPGRLATDKHGSIYVVDSYKNCVRQFDGTGSYKGLIAVKRPSAVAAADAKVYIGSHFDYSVSIYKRGEVTGHLGSGKNEFLSVADIAIDQSSGDVYVVDTKAQVIKVYYPSGSPKRTLSGFHLPTAVSVTAAGVYVLDAPTGPCPPASTGTSTVGEPAESNSNSQCTQVRIAIVDKKGALIRSIVESGEDQLIRPSGIAVDAFENVYVADTARKAILVYDRLGSFIGAMTSALDELRIPASLTISHDGNLLVSSSETHSIVQIGLTGKNPAGVSGSLEFKSKAGAAVSLAVVGY